MPCTGRHGSTGRRAPAFIGWTMGVNHSTKGTDTVNAINNLALITGNIGRSGASPFSITGQCNAMGTREAGFASCLPGYRKFESTEDREDLAAIWGMPVDRIPAARGLAYPDIIEATLDGRIRALWIIATNPIVSFPNLGVLRQALDTLDFLVVQDGFHPTPTTELARPGAAGSHLGRERGHLHQLRAARQQGESRGRSARRSALRLRHLPRCRGGARLPRRSSSRRGPSPRDAFDEWKRVSAGRLCDYSGMTYEAIEGHGGMQWPYRGRGGRCRGHATAVRRRPLSDRRREGAAAAGEVGAVPRTADAGLSVRAEHRTHRRALAHAHQDREAYRSSSGSRRSRGSKSTRATPGGCGSKPHDRVDVVSQRGRVRNLELRVTETVRRGAGVRALPLGGRQRQSGHPERVRSVSRASPITSSARSGSSGHTEARSDRLRQGYGGPP